MSPHELFRHHRNFNNLNILNRLEPGLLSLPPREDLVKGFVLSAIVELEDSQLDHAEVLNLSGTRSLRNTTRPFRSLTSRPTTASKTTATTTDTVLTARGTRPLPLPPPPGVATDTDTLPIALEAEGPLQLRPTTLLRSRRPPRPLMALVTRDHHAGSAFDSSPESPPDLTSSSKSSKSSSFRTSGSSLGGDSPHDPSHFEDISLDQRDHEGVLTPGSLYGEAGDAQGTRDLKLSDVARFGRGSALTLPRTRSSRSSLSSRASNASTATLTGQPAPAAALRDLTGAHRPGVAENGAVVRGLRGSQSALNLPLAKPHRGPPLTTHHIFTGPAYGSPGMRSPSPSTRSPHAFASHHGSAPAPRLPRRASSRSSLHSAQAMSPPVRRGSWQPGRKTVQELEDEYHDSDEEVDDDAIIWNVPLSATTSRSMSASPDSSLDVPPTPLSVPMPQSAGFPRTNSLPRPETGSLHQLRRQRSTPLMPRSPPDHQRLRPRHASGRGASPRSPSPLRSPCDPAQVGGDPCKPRHKSWTNALDDLSTEARHLTAALEAHQRRHAPPQAAKAGATDQATVPPPASPLPLSPASGNANAAPTLQQQLHPSVSQAPSGKTVVTLPPVRKGEMMIDPLPPSKEKVKVLTRTRPSWLPPKDKGEERKHLREWKRMMEKSADADRKRAARLSSEAEARAAQDASLRHIWRNTVLPDLAAALAEPRTRELWWRGVPSVHRAEAWTKAVGNELHLSDASYYAALERAKADERRLQADSRRSEDACDADAGRRRATQHMRDDVDALAREPEWARFGSDEDPEVKDGEEPVAGRRWQLLDVLMAYAAYRSDVGYVAGLAVPAALLLAAGMRPPDAFCALANLWNRPAAMGYLLTSLRFRAQLRDRRDRGDGDGDAREGAREPPSAPQQVRDLRASVCRVLEAKYPSLHAHLTSRLALHPSAFVDPLASCALADPRLGLARLLRTWDVLAFEGERAAARAVAALLGALEGRLLACRGRDDVARLVGWDGAEPWNLAGDEERWMQVVRDVGRAERKGED